MATYSDLELDKSYLIIEQEGEEIKFVTPIMETDACILLEVSDDLGTTVWRKKYDDFFELVDELSDEQVAEYDSLFDEDDYEEED